VKERERLNMKFDEIERELERVIEQCRTFDRVDDDVLIGCLEFNAAGEYRLALEELCRELYEHDVVVPLAIYETIVTLGVAMKVKADEWEILAKGSR
jgi:hypothetical protein